MSNPHSNNPYGRPVGSRNQAGHKAGGAGRGQGMKSIFVTRLKDLEDNMKESGRQ